LPHIKEISPGAGSKGLQFPPISSSKVGAILSTLFFPVSAQQLPEPARGITDRPIAYGRKGRVKYRGTYWSAQLYQPDRQLVISTGDPVNIVAIQGITLLVVPVNSF
jgi:NfeD-like C-terminal, partner-binding